MNHFMVFIMRIYCNHTHSLTSPAEPQFGAKRPPPGPCRKPQSFSIYMYIREHNIILYYMEGLLYYNMEGSLGWLEYSFYRCIDVAAAKWAIITM
jgi:hypothetical protein